MTKRFKIFKKRFTLLRLRNRNSFQSFSNKILMTFRVPIFSRKKKIRLLLLFQRSFHHRGTFFAIDRETILERSEVERGWEEEEEKEEERTRWLPKRSSSLSLSLESFLPARSAFNKRAPRPLVALCYQKWGKGRAWRSERG